MSLWSVATTAANPYLLWIKLAAVVLLLGMIIGVYWYVKSTFAQRDALLKDKAQLEFSLTMEKQKVVVAMEQLKIWQDTVAKMNASIKNIKIESNTVIQGVENEIAPEFNGRTSIPFILPSMSSSPSMPRHAPYSSGRASSSTETGRAIP